MAVYVLCEPIQFAHCMAQTMGRSTLIITIALGWAAFVAAFLFVLHTDGRR